MSRVRFGVAAFVILLTLIASILIFRQRRQVESDSPKVPEVAVSESGSEADAIPLKNLPAKALVEPPSRSPVSTRFRADKECAISLRSKALMEHQLSMCELPSSIRRDPEQSNLVEFCRKRKLDFQPKLSLLADKIPECIARGIEDAEERYFTSTLEAAEAGDYDAEFCYFNSSFSLKRPWTAAETTQYATLAPRYLESAFERGDWRFIEALRATSSSVAGSKGLIFQITSGDANYRYRMNRLLRLGADGQYARYLDALKKLPEPPYAPADIAESEIWAQQMFDRFFRHAGRLSTAPAGCT